jgi:hypothetical protein
VYNETKQRVYKNTKEALRLMQLGIGFIEGVEVEEKESKTIKKKKK